MGAMLLIMIDEHSDRAHEGAPTVQTFSRARQATPPYIARKTLPTMLSATASAALMPSTPADRMPPA